MDNPHRHGRSLGHLRGAVAPRTGYDLEAVFREWANEQGRQHTLAAD
jgi:hypothetical protein